MELEEELERIAQAAAAFALTGEDVAAVIPAEPASGIRVYLCAFTVGDERSWLVLDAAGGPIDDRALVRDAVSIAALCELAEESAAGGRLHELREQLLDLGRVEGQELVKEAVDALTTLEAALEPAPRIASTAYLDRIGAATRTLEQALGEIGASPFAEAMKQGTIAVEGLGAEIESAYKLPLS